MYLEGFDRPREAGTSEQDCGRTPAECGTGACLRVPVHLMQMKLLVS